MKYSAIDLHSNNNVLVVTDETDWVCRKNLALSSPLGHTPGSFSWVPAREFVLRDGVCRVKS